MSGRIVRLLGVGALVFLMLLPSMHIYAQDGTWVSSIQVQNLGDEPANIVIEYYDQDGNRIDAATQLFADLQPGASVNAYAPSIAGLPDGFIGSAVVYSDQPVAAIGNLTDIFSPTTVGSSSYGGVGAPASEVYLPLVMRAYGGSNWDTEIAVQNCGASEADITITFYDSAGNPIPAATENATIQPSASNVFGQADNAGLSDGYIGSAVVQTTSPDKVVGVIVNEIAGLRLVTYNGFASAEAGTTAYLPLIMNHYGGSDWVTSFQVMNVGTADASITIEYYSAGSTTPDKTVKYDGVENPMIGPMSSINRFQPAVDSDLGTGWIGAVQVTSNNGQPIVAIGNEAALAAGKAGATSYNAFKAGATEVNLPLVMLNYGGSNWVTSFQVMNVGTADADVTIEYYAIGSTIPDKTVHYDGVENPLIPPLNAINRYQPGVDSGLGMGWIGAVQVTSNNGQPVVAIANESALGKSGDVSTTYNGLW